MTNLEFIKEAYENEDFKEALSFANRFLSEGSQNFEVLSYKGASELRLNLNHEAVETFTKCLSIDEQKFSVWVFRGDAYYELEEYDKAFSDYWYSLQLRPDNGAVMDKCARSLFRIGNRQYALEYIAKAVEQSESVEPFIIMATMLDVMGENEDADKIRNVAVAKFPLEATRIKDLKGARVKYRK